ncbi:MAG: hypothetical protein QY322_03050 [bacterium]|nr:MAG: hypothetical protein QY322_03050 [bacterium]
MVKIRYSYKKDLLVLIYINLAILIILFSLFNIQSHRNKEVAVLGATDNSDYWEEITLKHPTYRDAWVELGRMDKVYEIDPNYNR